jgi:hypothetical protein
MGGWSSGVARMTTDLLSAEEKKAHADLITDMRRLLDSLSSPQDVLHKLQMAQLAQLTFAEIALRAERRLGQLLQEMETRR